MLSVDACVSVSEQHSCTIALVRRYAYEQNHCSTKSWTSPPLLPGEEAEAWHSDIVWWASRLSLAGALSFPYAPSKDVLLVQRWSLQSWEAREVRR